MINGKAGRGASQLVKNGRPDYIKNEKKKKTRGQIATNGKNEVKKKKRVR